MQHKVRSQHLAIIKNGSLSDSDVVLKFTINKSFASPTFFRSVFERSSADSSENYTGEMADGGHLLLYSRVFCRQQQQTAVAF